MIIRLEKIDHAKRQRRFYALSVVPTLFGEWALVREWGRIGAHGGQRKEEWHVSEAVALAECERIKRQKERKGYITRPEQLSLPL